MAVDSATQKQIRDAVDGILELKGRGLVSRPNAWGTMKFEEAEQDMETIFFIADALTNLPIEQMPQGSANALRQHLASARDSLAAIDSFSVEQNNAQQQRQQLIGQIQGHAEQLYNTAMPHIAFLSVRRGDVGERLKELEETLRKGETMISSTREELESKKAQLETIAASAQEAAAATGAAVFTGEFGTEASEQVKTARGWLVVTGALALATIVAAAWFWPGVGSEPHWWDIVHAVTAKLALLTLLFSATVWTGGIVRARYHQATINKHRSLGLKTFQAFVTASRDDRTKDAVLIEAARSIFGDVPTGFIESGTRADEPSMRFVEVGRATVEAAAKAAS